MILCRSVQRSRKDASCRRGSRAPLERSGVMIIEKGQVAMVASGSMASFATIESPEGTTLNEMMSAVIRAKLLVVGPA